MFTTGAFLFLCTFGVGGIISLFMALGYVVAISHVVKIDPAFEPSYFARIAFLSAVLSGISFFIACWLEKKEKRIERVAPITYRNASLLPPEESLVRASDVPTNQQGELLRAVHYGEQTPAQELLRAGQQNDQG